MNKIGGIYGIQNLITDRVYVGSSVNMSNRLKHHTALLKQGNHPNKHLQRSWNKHGEKSFKFFFIEECDKELLYEREQFWFDYYKENWLVYNVREVVESNKGFKHSDETKKKISEINIGKHHSEKIRKKMSESHRGKKNSIEHNIHISESKKGVKLSEETKKKISEAHKGRVAPNKGKRMGEEARKKMSEAKKGCKPWNKGVKMSDEFRRKCRERQLGKTYSDETKKRMSEAHMIKNLKEGE